ncbi:major pollen allergen Ole e 10-like [Impatiens glandulifera]|uniref:major pollen allergen Ole e 10-like n=1 Tax=Impatiens glandulifera TaxID=253017 RepID=UPI001FB086B2|nr:major pollen allergen Ole e 10-like [Impatiens glandulifera]
MRSMRRMNQWILLNYFSMLLISTSIIIADITTPIPTVPTTPATPTVINPTVSDPDSPVSGGGNPFVIPSPTTTTSYTPEATGGASWCVAVQSASQAAIQLALDYACGHGADCSAIQPAGECYRPNTMRDHASYAFNSYYQKNPIPTSCNFGGTAIITSTDPSYVNCQFPTTSTSSSILNTTNSIGSTVFGAGPITPTSSLATPTMYNFNLFLSYSFIFLIATIFL